MSKLNIAVVLIGFTFFNAPKVHAADFAKPVECKSDEAGTVSITPAGHILLAEKNGPSRTMPFEECRFELIGINSSADKIPRYVCTTDGVSSSFFLEGSNSGAYELSERLSLKNTWSINDTNKNAAKYVKSMQRKIGTYKCVDPTFEATIAEINQKMQSTAPKNAKPVLRR